LGSSIVSSTETLVNDLQINITTQSDSILEISFAISARIASTPGADFEFRAYASNTQIAIARLKTEDANPDEHMMGGHVAWTGFAAGSSGEQTIEVRYHTYTASNNHMFLTRNLVVKEYIPNSGSAGEFGGNTLLAIMLAINITLVISLLRKRKSN